MGEQKFVRMFGRPEIHITACAVTRDRDFNNVISDIIIETNQFWDRYPPHHERALLKMYQQNPGKNLICNDSTQTLRIPMLFLGNNSNDGWGELQFLIKAPRLVRLARHRCFDTRVNQWVPETKLIQPKTNMETHAYLALRFYHNSYLPPKMPKTRRWYFEPVYVSIRNSDFYKIDVLWEKEKIKITVTVLDKNSPEIPKHLR
ncbi:MAG: hypothetical protein HYW79_00470 [Parcubacteria group bacterium]|nr:hypothetical protein [Parcubacteria group bacterium]